MSNQAARKRGRARPVPVRPGIDCAYQMRIELLDIEPPVWRRLVVRDTLTFHDLHEVIQVVMGWQKCHLFEFRLGDLSIGVPHAEFGRDEIADAVEVKLRDVSLPRGSTVNYLYDFGDGWEHHIEIERVVDGSEGARDIACIDGARACPPEDCGGVYGYGELLAALADPRHPQHKELGEWLGYPFDPDHFDLKGTSAALASLRL